MGEEKWEENNDDSGSKAKRRIHHRHSNRNLAYITAAPGDHQEVCVISDWVISRSRVCYSKLLLIKKKRFY